MSDAFSRQAPQCLSSLDWIASKSPRHDGTAAFFLLVPSERQKGLPTVKTKRPARAGRGH